MTVIVYGKDGCGICDAAKDKVDKLGFACESRSLEYYTQVHEGWREDGSVSVAAANAVFDTMPLIEIKGEFFDYPSSMKLLKRMRKDLLVNTQGSEKEAEAALV